MRSDILSVSVSLGTLDGQAVLPLEPTRFP